MRIVPRVSRDVLVVDDDAPTRRLFEHVLQRAGLSVVTAVDGIDAQAVLETHHVDAIVLDLMMPRMSGFELLDYFTRERTELLRHTVILSAASLQMVSDAEAYPVSKVLRKPVDIDLLLNAVLDCLIVDGAGPRKSARAATRRGVTPAAAASPERP